MLTSEQYLQSMEAKAERKEQARREAELRKVEAEKKKGSRAAEKLQKEAEKAQREVDAAGREAFKQKWSADAIRQAGEHLQWLVKNAPPPLPGAYRPPFCGVLPAICKENMARRLAKRRLVKYGIGSGEGILPSTPPAWVHQGDPMFVIESPDLPASDVPQAAPCRGREVPTKGPATASAGPLPAPPRGQQLPHPRGATRPPARANHQRLANLGVVAVAAQVVGTAGPATTHQFRSPPDLVQGDADPAPLPHGARWRSTSGVANPHPQSASQGPGAGITHGKEPTTTCLPTNDMIGLVTGV